jgi:hypothetical protein
VRGSPKLSNILLYSGNINTSSTLYWTEKYNSSLFVLHLDFILVEMANMRQKFIGKSTEYIKNRVEIGGVYLPSQLERTLQLCT